MQKIKSKDITKLAKLQQKIDKYKKNEYTSRDEFINDDNLSDKEKTEICEAILEAEKGE